MGWGFIDTTNYFDIRVKKGLAIQPETCVLCGKQPQFKPWQGRELIILEHKCSNAMNFSTFYFPKELDKAVEDWNKLMRGAHDRVAKLLQARAEAKTSSEVTQTPYLTLPNSINVLKGIYWMAGVNSRDELQNPPEGEEFAMALDVARSVGGQAYVWCWSNGKWSDESVLKGNTEK